MSAQTAFQARPVAKRPQVLRAVSCSAEVQAPEQKMAKAAAAAALALAISVTGVEAAKADVAGLTPCAESKAFAKRKKQEVKALEKRLKNVRGGLLCNGLCTERQCGGGVQRRGQQTRAAGQQPLQAPNRHCCSEDAGDT